MFSVLSRPLSITITRHVDPTGRRVGVPPLFVTHYIHVCLPCKIIQWAFRIYIRTCIPYHKHQVVTSWHQSECFCFIFTCIFFSGRPSPNFESDTICLWLPPSTHALKMMLRARITTLYICNDVLFANRNRLSQVV